MQKQNMARRRCVVNFAKLEHFFKHLKEKAKYTLYIVHAYHFLITGGGSGRHKIMTAVERICIA